MGDYEELIKKENPDFVGITAHTCEERVAIDCARKTKNINNRIITIVGGIQPTISADEFIKSGVVDFIFKGEGEKSLPELLNNPQKFSQVFYGEPPDLDEIPFEDRELWPDYRQRIHRRIINFSGKLPVVDILTKRGCPWQCRFCCGPGEQNLYTKETLKQRIPFIRSRSVGNVIEELRLLYDKYRFKSIIFHDDQFILDFNWTEYFCQAMRDYGFVKKNIKFWAEIRADIICHRPDLIEKLKGVGLETCSVGFESFSKRMLEWMNKGVGVRENIQAADILKRLKIKIFANTILGMPYKDGKWYVEDDLKTFRAIKKINPFHWSYSFFSPIPGSDFYHWFLKRGLILDNSSRLLGQRCIINANVRSVDYEFLNKLLKRYLFYREPLWFFLKSSWGMFKRLNFFKNNI